MHAEIVYYCSKLWFFIYSILLNRDVNNLIRSIHLIFIPTLSQKSNPWLCSASTVQIRNILSLFSSKPGVPAGSGELGWREDFPLLWRCTSGLLRPCQEISRIWHTYARVAVLTAKIKTEAMILQPYPFHSWDLIKYVPSNFSLNFGPEAMDRISSATEFPQQTSCPPAPAELTHAKFIIKEISSGVRSENVQPTLQKNTNSCI